MFFLFNKFYTYNKCTECGTHQTPDSRGRKCNLNTVHYLHLHTVCSDVASITPVDVRVISSRDEDGCVSSVVTLSFALHLDR
jgi:hypothetical protein